ncbi:MAG TPA: ATP-binding protein [Verrucomicrobiota bacterium]|nr:ATP-binding protein [Verrucomicrobiota bacterium]
MSGHSRAATAAAALALLAVLRLLQAPVHMNLLSTPAVSTEVVGVLASLLVLVGIIHTGAVLEARRRAELQEKQMERRVAEKTQELAAANASLRETAERLEAEIAERSRVAAQMEQTYKDLLVASREAGMSEVATNVLHNVGNVLNSVNISASLVADHVARLRVANVSRVADLLDANSEEIVTFLTTDPRGRQLPAYIRDLGQHLTQQQEAIIRELEFVRKKIAHIKDIVVVQQDYARVSGLAEPVRLSELVEDALHINTDVPSQNRVEFIAEIPPDDEILVERHKLLQILVNLVQNARHACEESDAKDKRVIVRVSKEEDRVKIAVIDNGVGIPHQNLTKIFNHGFTTRKDGHGFGLHSGALVAKELGGTLVAESPGPGLGATFTLDLPLRPPDTRS